MGPHHDIPTSGICLGMQMIVIEFARNVLGYKSNPRVSDEKTHNVIDIMEEIENISNMGWELMRLGASTSAGDTSRQGGGRVQYS